MMKCKSCQLEIDEKASICPHCRTKQPEPFKTILKAAIVVFIMLFLYSFLKRAMMLGSGGTASTGSVASTSYIYPTSQPTPIIISASNLVAEFDKNKLAAQDKYTGRVVQTTAYVNNISNDITGHYFLSLNPTSEQYYFGTHLQCFFKDKSALIVLTNGQQVTVQGTMQDMSLGIVEIENCVVLVK